MVRREYPDSPLLGVGAVIFDSDYRVLLIRRASEPAKGHWSLPGGLVELGETLQEAVRREVTEETGLFVEPSAVVEVVDRIYKASTLEEDSNFTDVRVRYHYVVIDFWCRLTGGKLSAGSDASEVCWATQKQWRQVGEEALDSKLLEVIEKGLSMAQAAQENG